MKFRIVTHLLTAAVFSSLTSHLVHAQVTLTPNQHCRDFSPDAIVSFADRDLEAVVREALELDSQEVISCGKAATLETLIVGTSIERVVYGGTLRPSPDKPFESLAGLQNLSNLTQLNLINRLITDITPVGLLAGFRVVKRICHHFIFIDDIGNNIFTKIMR